MSSKALNLVLTFSLLGPTALCGAAVEEGADGLQKDSVLRIYLPRAVTVEGSGLRLGDVGIIRGRESWIDKARGIALGRISMPGQKVVIDRSTVLSRLACNGIPANKVVLTGAEKVTVKQREQVIKGSEFVDVASSFLKGSLGSGSVCRMNPIVRPSDLIIPGGGGDVTLSPCLVKNGAKNRATVRIAALADGEQIETRDVTFVLKHRCRRAIALADIPAGTAISPENVKIEEVLSDYPEPAGWNPPYGLITKRRIPAKAVIRSNMAGPSVPEVLVKRNRMVVIRVDRPGLLVTAFGKAIQDGRAGECIKVRNADSRRIILARVNEDGTVEPVF
ncbi:MAG: flagellar basal body P-ring formation chaperone FlgA [Planctomycetota bacterium]